MSRFVYVGRDSRGYVSIAKSTVSHCTEVWDGDQTPHTRDTLLAAIDAAWKELVADGIPSTEIRFDLAYDREPDYGDDRITPKMIVTGVRPATENETHVEVTRQDAARRQAEQTHLARLRAQLAEAERRLR